MSSIPLPNGWLVVLLLRLKSKLGHLLAIALVCIVVQVRRVDSFIHNRGAIIIFIVRCERDVHHTSQGLAFQQFLGLFYLTLGWLCSAL